MIKLIILFIVFTIQFCSQVYAQTPFQLTIGGTGNDNGQSIIQTTDGGYAMAGYTNSFGAGDWDMYIVKIDASGILQWSRTVGGAGNDRAYSIIQTTDGGYTMAGETNSYGTGGADMYIVKLDGSGTLLWSRTVGGGYNDPAYSIVKTTDGGYAVAGWTYSFVAGSADMYLVKLDSTGNPQWSRTVGGSDMDRAYSIIQTTDGGYALAGLSRSFGGLMNNYVVKFNASGTLQWSRIVGGPSNDYANSIIQTTDGGYGVAGWIGAIGAGGLDMYIVKLDSSGSLQWTRTVGGTGNETYEDGSFTIIRTADGGFAVAGGTSSFGAGDWDMYIVKLDGSGTLQWSRTVGGTGYERAYSVIQTTDGGYAIAGYTSSFGAAGNDCFIVKLDATGNACGNSTTPTSISGTGGTSGTGGATTSPTSIVTTPVPTVLTNGTVTIVCRVTGIEPNSNEIPSSYSLSQNYPNPFNPVTKIKFQIPSDVKGEMSSVRLLVYDIGGREISTLINEQLNPGKYEIEFNGSNFPSGVYFYKLTAGSFIETKKMLMIK